MNTDNISPSATDPAPPPEPPLPEPPLAEAPPEPPTNATRRISPWLFVAIAALALAGWQWLETRQQLDETRSEVARRLADADTAGQEARGARNQLQRQIEDLQARFGVIESRLAEFASQGDALQSMYEDLARSREEATLLEVQQALTLAEQQLQLAGNVAVAALALQTAEARLARLDKPLYQPLRNALVQDLARLNAQPFADVAGISQRLEEIIGRIDQLPLLALERPTASSRSTLAEAEVGGAWWRLAVADAWQAVRGLVRIQRFDREEPVLLPPEQSFFLRENLKLRLLNARLALLARDHGSFRNELKVAQDWLQRYFAASEPAVKESQEKLQQLLATDLDADLPSLSDSLTALAKLRGGKDQP